MWLSDWDSYDAREAEYNDRQRARKFRRDRVERRAIERARKESRNA